MEREGEQALISAVPPSGSVLRLLLWLLILAAVNVVQEVIQIGFTCRRVLAQTSSVLLILWLVALLLLLLLRVPAEHYPVLNNVRVWLQVRQGSLLTVGPLGDIVHVALHHG